jgi:hypothetical protein
LRVASLLEREQAQHQSEARHVLFHLFEIPTHALQQNQSDPHHHHTLSTPHPTLDWARLLRCRPTVSGEPTQSATADNVDSWSLLQSGMQCNSLLTYSAQTEVVVPGESIVADTLLCAHMTVGRTTPCHRKKTEVQQAHISSLRVDDLKNRHMSR